MWSCYFTSCSLNVNIVSWNSTELHLAVNYAINHRCQGMLSSPCYNGHYNSSDIVWSLQLTCLRLAVLNIRRSHSMREWRYVATVHAHVVHVIVTVGN